MWFTLRRPSTSYQKLITPKKTVVLTALVLSRSLVVMVASFLTTTVPPSSWPALTSNSMLLDRITHVLFELITVFFYIPVEMNYLFISLIIRKKNEYIVFAWFHDPFLRDTLGMQLCIFVRSLIWKDTMVENTTRLKKKATPFLFVMIIKCLRVISLFFYLFFINICFDLPIKLFAELAEAEQSAHIEL